MRRSATDHRTLSSRAARLVGTDLERCIFCNGAEITREGRRHKKLETVQLWYCHSCGRVFTPQRAKGKTYPLKIILESLMLYYRGDTRTHVAKRIKERFGIAIPPRTLSTWISALTRQVWGLRTDSRPRLEAPQLFLDSTSKAAHCGSSSALFLANCRNKSESGFGFAANSPTLFFT